MRPIRLNKSSRSRRRGVTLLEMLVTVALLLLMMLIIVAIFQSATGAVTTSRAFTLLDQDLRRLDTTIRQDLMGVEAIMTPPGLDPNDVRPRAGYFEYAENALSDAQDEDSDDTLRFTAKAPEGKFFTGRVWLPKSMPTTDGRYGTFATMEPVPATSQYAEVIYFQRGDKLYRRVRLIQPVPTLSFGTAPTFAPPSLNTGNTPTDPKINSFDPASRASSRFGFRTTLFEPIGLFRPITFGAGTIPTMVGGMPFVSWQGLNDVSARPSPFIPARPFDYAPILNDLADLDERHNRYASPRFADDFKQLDPASGNWIFVPDGLPDDENGDGVVDRYPTLYWNSKAAGLLNDTYGSAIGPANSERPLTRDTDCFPWVYPNPFTGGTQALIGLLHTPDPSLTTFNHNPLVAGDSLDIPPMPTGAQTWWGFPTWRETMAPTWLDPIKRVNDPATAPFFAETMATAIGEMAFQQTVGLSPTRTFAGTPFWLPPQPGPFSDGVPTTGQNNIYDLTSAPVYEDDLIAVNVRSFNIKAFDPNPRYFNATTSTVVQLLPGFYDLGYASGLNPAHSTQTPMWMLDTLGHEGRMPPLMADNRVDAQHPTFNDASGNPVAAGLGDDTAGVVRMRRTWDSWSTTYTKAPAQPLNPALPYPFCGPIGNGRAVTPSYPAPYPVPLRGIEIQIRVVDPTSRYVKSLTIRQDFTEKL